MNRASPQPDDVSRLLSHLVVGAAAGALGRKAGFSFMVVAILGAAAHAAFDAPLATVLTDHGV